MGWNCNLALSNNFNKTKVEQTNKQTENNSNHTRPDFNEAEYDLLLYK